MNSYNCPFTDTLTHGGCYGPNAEYIKFISSDDHEIYIKEDYTVVSKTIKEIFQARGVLKEEELNRVVFDQIPSHLLVKVCQYFTFKAHFTSKCFKTVPRFKIDENIIGDLLGVANMLLC
ncbi:elongin-C [Trichonephila inaurata madagascariensis]|uniref:Elongin-C n=1 Tax=Trichonephila inaurata madagascariensis TaxID=2747483 RepID=A0A8X7CFG4_9ARAC|nr:elongin-C [Trichonephila inaurata madagascariensis]